MELDLRFKKKISNKYLKYFNLVSNNSISKFNTFFEKISYNKNLDWWLSSPASRYNLTSPLFHNFCIFEFIKYLHIKKKLPSVIIIDSESVFVELNKFIVKNSIQIKIKYKKNYFFNLKLFTKNILILFYQLFYRLFQLFIFRFFFSSNIVNIDKIILIDKYIFPGFINKERYYNGLLENLGKEMVNSIYFVPTLAMIKVKNLFKTYKTLKNSNRNYIFKEKYYSLKSIFYSIGHFFRKRNIKFDDAIFQNIDFTGIIKEELRNDTIAFFAAIEGFLTIEFIKSLKYNGTTIKKIIDWHENQTIDKAWNYGFNTYYPEVDSLGYKGMVPSQMLLSEMYCLEVERANNLLPKKIGVIGNGYISEAKKYNNSSVFTVCPAFRFNYLWNIDNVNKNINKTILFALPITIDQSIQILSELDELSTIYKNYNVLIKPHPTSDKNIYINFLKSINFYNFKIIDDNAKSILPNIDIFVGGMSSISLEAICMGIKTVIVENNLGINYFTIPKNVSKNFYKLLQPNMRLKNLIHEIEIEKNSKLTLKEISIIKRKYFEPINEESLNNFIN